MVGAARYLWTIALCVAVVLSAPSTAAAQRTRTLRWLIETAGLLRQGESEADAAARLLRHRSSIAGLVEHTSGIAEITAESDDGFRVAASLQDLLMVERVPRGDIPWIRDGVGRGSSRVSMLDAIPQDVLCARMYCSVVLMDETGRRIVRRARAAIRESVAVDTPNNGRVVVAPSQESIADMRMLLAVNPSTTTRYAVARPGGSVVEALDQLAASRHAEHRVIMTLLPDPNSIDRIYDHPQGESAVAMIGRVTTSFEEVARRRADVETVVYRPGGGRLADRLLAELRAAPRGVLIQVVGHTAQGQLMLADGSSVQVRALMEAHEGVWVWGCHTASAIPTGQLTIGTSRRMTLEEAERFVLHALYPPSRETRPAPTQPAEPHEAAPAPVPAGPSDLDRVHPGVTLFLADATNEGLHFTHAVG